MKGKGQSGCQSAPAARSVRLTNLGVLSGVVRGFLGKTCHTTGFGLYGKWLF